MNWTECTVTLGELIPWERNPKRISKASAKRLLDFWQRIGQFQTVAIGPSSEVYDGHQRLSVLKAAFGKSYTIKALRAERALTEAEREELFAQAHYGTVGQLDWDMLAGFDPDLLTGAGFDADLLATLNDDAANLALLLTAEKEAPVEDAGGQIDRAAELLEIWGVQTGDVWEIASKTATGSHRLVCGDCTNRAVVEQCMQGEKAGLMVTDPPYGVEYDPEWRLRAGVADVIHGDKIAGDNNFDWLRTFSIYCPDLIYVWCASWFIPVVQMRFEGLEYLLKYIIIWNKDLQVLGRGCYHWKHEPLLFMSKSGAPLLWNGLRDQTTVWDIPTIHSFKNGHNAEEWGLLGHSTQKPLECMERPIRNHDAPIIYDPFAGSGTTGVACERQGRVARMIEISPAYTAVCLQRLKDLGLEPILCGAIQ